MSRRALILWAPVGAYAAVLYVLAIQQDVSALPSLNDKLLHALGYGLFGVLAIRAFHGGLGPLAAGRTFLAFLVTVGYGTFTELNQLFLAGRSASVADVAADAAGFALAVLGVFLVFHLTRRAAAPGDR